MTLDSKEATEKVKPYFACSFCNVKFTTKENLKLHNELHIDTHAFSCPLCKEIFPDLYQLQLHDLHHSLVEAQEDAENFSEFAIVVSPSAYSVGTICNDAFKCDKKLYVQHGEVESEQVLNDDFIDGIDDSMVSFNPALDENHAGKETVSYQTKLSLKESNLNKKPERKPPYECDTCKKIFSTYNILQRHHNYVHLTKRQHSCLYCNKKFSLKSLCTRHILLHHEIKKTFHCKCCQKVFNKPYLLQQHTMMVHGCEKKLSCHTCLKFFAKRSELMSHMKKHIGDGSLNCVRCLKQFKSGINLMKHRCLYAGPRHHVCKVCGKRFNRRYHLTRHSDLHNRELALTEDSLHKSEIESTGDNLTHTSCDVTKNTIRKMIKCSTSNPVVIHYDQQTLVEDKIHKQSEYCIIDMTADDIETVPFTKRQFVCYVCQKNWPSSTAYKNHFFTAHNDLQLNRCPICSRQFTKSSQVRRHLQTHSDRKPHICKICNKRFTSPSTMKRHLANHESCKRLVCYQCPKTFADKTGFQKHIQMHEKAKSSDFKCSICNKKFPEEKHLNEHILAFHDFFKEYQCHVCKRRFSHCYYLDRHMTSHTGLKKFKCFKCNQRFGTKSDLNRHSLSHLDLKLYPCIHCSKVFSRNANRQKHLVVVHGVK